MGFLEERGLEDVASIPEYFKGKTIFVTGGTGFMGKVLIEKLLYSCTDLDRIYLLLRDKKGVKAEDRLANLYSSKCFDRLRKERPGVFESKVFFIAGDVCELGLGISDEDRMIIVNNVHIVYHVAACVRFDDSLKTASKLNLRGTREVIEIAKEMKRLEVLVHVSTSYANTNREVIDEVVYPALADWKDTLEVCEQADDHTLNVLTPKYLGELPNTYVFTKQLAENLVYEQRGKLPIVIIRPSIVISSVSEPMPGWIENLNGPVGILIASGKGILRSIYTNPDIVSDYIPVDCAIKVFIAAAWIRGTKKFEPTDDVEVYNCSTSHMETMTIGEIVEHGRKISSEVPLEDILWIVGGSLTTSRFIFYVKVLLLHMLPALMIDVLLQITGRKPMLFRVQRRIYTAVLALQYFMTQQWTFKNDNMLSLRSKIKERDTNDFYYELENIDQKAYFMNACLGGKCFILNEKLEDLPKARARYTKMKLLDQAVKATFYLLLFWILIKSETVKYYVQSVLSFISL